MPTTGWPDSAARSTETFALVFSGHANTSTQIRREVERAVHHNIPIAPVRIQDVMPEGDMEYFLSSQHWMDALTPPFEKHLRETEGHVSRLEKVFKLIDVAPKGKKCEAIEGIIEEGAEIMKEFKGTAALDAGLISAAQAVEHYEIARYGTLKRWAEQMGRDDAMRLLDATLNEEKKTDGALTELADSMVNEQAQAAE